MNFFTYDADGNIINSGTCQPETLALYSVNGLTAIEGVADPFRHYFDIATGSVRDLDPSVATLRRQPPPLGFRWTRSGLIDERSLAQAKADKWREIKKARAAAEAAGFTVGGYTFDSDPASQAAIAAAVQDMSMAGGPATVAWTLANETTVTITATQMRAVLRALRNHIQTQRDKATNLRADIEAATTVAAVDALHW